MIPVARATKCTLSPHSNLPLLLSCPSTGRCGTALSPTVQLHLSPILFRSDLLPPWFSPTPFFSRASRHFDPHHTFNTRPPSPAPTCLIFSCMRQYRSARSDVRDSVDEEFPPRHGDNIRQLWARRWRSSHDGASSRFRRTRFAPNLQQHCCLTSTDFVALRRDVELSGCLAITRFGFDHGYLAAASSRISSSPALVRRPIASDTPHPDDGPPGQLGFLKNFTPEKKQTKGRLPTPPSHPGIPDRHQMGNLPSVVGPNRTASPH